MRWRYIFYYAVSFLRKYSNKNSMDEETKQKFDEVLREIKLLSREKEVIEELRTISQKLSLILDGRAQQKVDNAGVDLTSELDQLQQIIDTSKPG